MFEQLACSNVKVEACEKTQYVDDLPKCDRDDNSESEMKKNG
jgi:hypothetical protein